MARALHHQTLTPTVSLPAQAPALVLLHGWGASSAVWQPVLPRLREKFRITLIDLPGFGSSAGCAPGATLADWREQVLAVAPPQAVWMGSSLGGLLALSVAHHAPSRVAALALVAATPCFVQRPDWASAMPQVVFEQFHAQLMADPADALTRFFALQCLGSASMKADIRFLQAQRQTPGEGVDQGLHVGLDLLLTQDVREQFSALESPVWAVLGGQDQLVPKALKEALLALRPETEVAVIDGGAHLPFLSHPEVFASLFYGFCEQQGVL